MQVTEGDQNMYPVSGGKAEPPFPREFINSVNWPSWLGVGQQANNLAW